MVKNKVQNNIIVEGKNAHFDSKCVDAFMSSQCNKIIRIFLTEYNDFTINEDDERILAACTLKDLYDFLSCENPTREQTEFIDLFNSYYILKVEKKLTD